MTKANIFVQVQGKLGISDLEITTPITVGGLHDALKELGIDVSDDMEIFIDEADEAETKNRMAPIKELKHGARIHVTRCKKIKVTVNYLDQSADHIFAPGKRVRAVKKWAVSHFHINATDAGEHVLRLCNTNTQPPTDTPLAELVSGHECSVCFDLVPEKRVEG
ncbi:hypothetical protein ANOBCDAF_04421 [Pleomorphomonas sp. T1.2MG-36]|uniref:hypothetical protein n=1 Tax=Pleomorphomonas sp. T1.2MG-36 TaxID=3041167 RepID=UPI00247765DB|nr:hypothetical protein [Pleomorphomonas sp. T1.2MG-36]CAI9418934.1 hypothetical protein ANOBCDAF_04421 [Pleomorphomonas sp. T1.2MG-36]